MKLLTLAQRAKLLDNGRRQAAVKGTPSELDFASGRQAVQSVRRRAPGSSPRSIPMTKPSPGVCAISAWASRNSGRSASKNLPLIAVALGLGIERDLYFEPRGSDFGLHRSRKKSRPYRRRYRLQDVNGGAP